MVEWENESRNDGCSIAMFGYRRVVSNEALLMRESEKPTNMASLYLVIIFRTIFEFPTVYPLDLLVRRWVSRLEIACVYSLWVSGRYNDHADADDEDEDQDREDEDEDDECDDEGLK